MYQNFSLQEKNKKKTTQLERILSNILTTSTSADNGSLDNSVENYWKNQVYFVILDTVIINLKKRFSDESLLLVSAVDNFFLMNFDESQPFINHFKIKINS